MDLKTFDEDTLYYGCVNRVWRPKEESKFEVMKKYHLTEEEYCDIISILKKTLSTGECGWCI